MNKKNLGLLGENFAVHYLKSNNYVILERNFRFSRFGEIDIIAKDNEYICFIEVKTRTGSVFGTPSEAVNKSKQIKIKMLAQIYIKGKGLFNKNIRFDVIEVFVDNTNEKQEFKVRDINLIKNAFY
ncbi:MAG: YraN family protein [Firmicutes bacterium]|nr:YraN family protein [Bacillota bacterium]